MWTKIFLLISTTAMITAGAKIDGLQNDLGTGYTYNPPEQDPSPTIEGSLAYYINIPANQESGDYLHHFSNPEDLYIQPALPFSRPSQDFGGSNSISHGVREYSPNRDFGVTSHHNQYESLHRPSAPSHNHQFSFSSPAHPSPSSANRFQPAPYQIEPRNRLPVPSNNFLRGSDTRIQQSTVENLPRNTFRGPTNQNYRQPTLPNHEPQPTRSFDASARFRTAPSGTSHSKSYNVRLPFPIGTVPIKFKPLPLKTYLRQGTLLPISSYEANNYAYRH